MIRNDHDLLIEISTKLDALSQRVDDSSRSTGQRLEALASSKASVEEVSALRKDVAASAGQSDVNDHETRIRSLETWVWKAIGGVGAISIIAAILAILQWVKP